MVAVPAAVVFDVFGTVVDWFGSVTAELAAVAGPDPSGHGWAVLARRWRREGYLGPITEMAAGRLPLRPIDEVLREHLARLTAEFGVDLDDAGLDRVVAVWDRLAPWPDAVAGLGRLRRHFPVATLSNGTFAGLVRMARHAGLPWDAVICAEMFATFKPDPAVYLGAARLLGVAPDAVMLVAAHPPDLAAARRAGLQTAFVGRPLEWGPGAAPVPPDADADLVAGDLLELADTLIALRH